MAAEIILKLENLRKTYQSRGGIFGQGKEVVALDDISLEVHAGEVFGLVGESGSGKTTCGRLVVGLEKPDSGGILLNGIQVTGLRGKALRRYRRLVQMVFQDPYQSLNPQLSILDSVAEPLITHRACPAGEREDRAAEALRMVGLSPAEQYLYRFPHQLSGGQRQRAAIARAMILEPTCLVADEPTSMLDASYSAQIFQILLEVRKRLGSTIIFITHSLAAARYLCDRLAVIYHGQLMELGPAREVIANPRHPYTQALMEATPRFGRAARTAENKAPLLEGRRTAAPGVGCAFFPRCARADWAVCSRRASGWVEVGPDHMAACHDLTCGRAAAGGV